MRRAPPQRAEVWTSGTFMGVGRVREEESASEGGT